MPFFSTEVNGDFLTFGASLKWPCEELQFLVDCCWFYFFSSGGCCLGLTQQSTEDKLEFSHEFRLDPSEPMEARIADAAEDHLKATVVLWVDL